MSALKRAGHEVRLFSTRTSERLHEPFYRVRSALRVASGIGRWPAGLLAYEPDVIHVHNLFPNFGRRWVEQVDVPVVATLHNFRPICANALLLRDGRVCTRCPDGAPLSGFRFACYRGSRLATAPLTAATWSPDRRDPVLRSATRLLVMSDVMASIYERVGVERDRMVTMPNFLPDNLMPPPSGNEATPTDWLFVGRLAPEKGILELLRRWPGERRLTIVGDGPQRAHIEAASRDKAVHLAGGLPREAVLELMQRSIGLLFPSPWLEGSPLVYLEALANGLPVLAWQPNVLAHAVEREGTGCAVGRDANLREVLDRAESAFPSMRLRCTHVFEEHYSERAFIERAEQVYSDVVGHAAG